MKGGRVGVVGVLFLWALLPSLSAAGVLESVAVDEASPSAARLSFYFSAQAPEPRIFELADPPRFVVDFMDTSLGPALATPATAGLLRSFIGAEDGSRSRFVLTVSAPAELTAIPAGCWRLRCEAWAPPRRRLPERRR